MPRDKKYKLIFAAVIVVAFMVASIFSKNKFNDLFSKNDDNIILDEVNSPKEYKDKDISLEEKEDIEKKVYITGEINNPGVYDINEGDRLDDLVKRAGGLKERADRDNINLAMRLEDQMKIYIPNIDEKESIAYTNNSSINQSQIKESKVNINTASKEELMTLPNIGSKRADAIIEYRQNKRFESIEEIKNIKGIGDKYFDAMKDLITI